MLFKVDKTIQQRYKLFILRMSDYRISLDQVEAKSIAFDLLDQFLEQIFDVELLTGLRNVAVILWTRHIS